MSQTTELITDRLRLVPPEITDGQDITAQINSTEDIARNIFNIPWPYTAADAENWLSVCHEGWENRTSFRFAVKDKDTGQFMGMIGLLPDTAHQKAEVGYWLGKDFHGFGYATEALKTVIQFGFENLTLNKIFATHFAHNPASGKVLQKAGMKHEGFLKQEYRHREIFQDVHRYGILRKEWKDIMR